MPTRNVRQGGFCNSKQLSHKMFMFFNRKFHTIRSKIRWLFKLRRPSPKLVIKRFRKVNIKKYACKKKGHSRTYSRTHHLDSKPTICVATFNVAMFSLAPAVPKEERSLVSISHHPKSILKQHQSPLNPLKKLKVSINLPENEISLANNKLLCNLVGHGVDTHGSMRSPVFFPAGMFDYMNDGVDGCLGSGSSRSILDVLREVNAEVLALQDVRAVEENNMKPLSDLAHKLGMNYVFAESWAPEYGNAILSKWPIKRWRVQKIFDDQDFRNILRATIDVPQMGEFNFYCTQLDHLDEKWRVKQINAIIQSNDGCHILAGGLNSLDGTDYSAKRWNDIVRYYEEIGKPTPKAEVMKFLKGKGYVDSKELAGECEPVVIIAKGQNVQGTCKYGTRVDYIMASPDLPYKFIPGSYSVVSSKGTSDHHVVKVEIAKSTATLSEVKHKVLRIPGFCSSERGCIYGT